MNRIRTVDYVFALLRNNVVDDVEECVDGFGFRVPGPHVIALSAVESMRRYPGVADVTLEVDGDDVFIRVHDAVDTGVVRDNDAARLEQRGNVYLTNPRPPPEINALMEKCGTALVRELPTGAMCTLEFKTTDTKLSVLCALSRAARVSHDDLQRVNVKVRNDGGVVSVCAHRGRLAVLVAFPLTKSKASKAKRALPPDAAPAAKRSRE